MRPNPTARRQSAITIVFAAWCAVYGLPADFARSLTAQTGGLSDRAIAKPVKQANVLLHRLTTQVRRAEQARLPIFAAFLNPAHVPLVSAIIPSAWIRNPQTPRLEPSPAASALAPRAPPVSFPS